MALPDGSHEVMPKVQMLVTHGKIKLIDCVLEAPPEQAKVREQMVARYHTSVVLGPWRRCDGFWSCQVLQQLPSQ